MKRIKQLFFRPKKHQEWDGFTSRHYDETEIHHTAPVDKPHLVKDDEEDDIDGLFTSWRQYILS